MIEEINTHLYRLDIPLPGSPLKSLNSYVIKSKDRNLIIDTGWNRRECLEEMLVGLRGLGIDLRRTDFFITHSHVDHLGLVSRLVTETSRIYFNKPDADRFSSGFRWDEFLQFARLNGYPEEKLQRIRDTHPGLRYRAEGKLDFHILREGDTLRIGDYLFRCVETPGHTRGHLCLYESEKKIFISGDHILEDISPNIQLWSDEWNPLREYLLSLDKVFKLDIELVLPGHRRIFRDCRRRIEELKLHHERRFDEIISILRRGSGDAFQVASQMSWDIIYDSWDLFPSSQKWFATGEVIAHLKYLEEGGVIRKEEREQRRLFSLIYERASRTHEGKPRE